VRDPCVGEFSWCLDDPSVLVGLCWQTISRLQGQSMKVSKNSDLDLILAGLEPSIEDLLELSGVTVAWADLDLKYILAGRFWGHGLEGN